MAQRSHQCSDGANKATCRKAGRFSCQSKEQSQSRDTRGPCRRTLVDDSVGVVSHPNRQREANAGEMMLGQFGPEHGRSPRPAVSLSIDPKYLLHFVIR
jgi:hypothetical protein